MKCLSVSLFIHYINYSVRHPLIHRPDITVMVDWALKLINYIYLSIHSFNPLFIQLAGSRSISKLVLQTAGGNGVMDSVSLLVTSETIHWHTTQHTHTHTHTIHIHTYTHTHSHTHTHTHTIHILSLTHTHTRTHTFPRTRIHTKFEAS